MAGTKVSALTAGAALGGTEAIPAVQSAATVKITAAQIKTFTSASPTLVTPVLGVAAGTSLALGGATLGSNALAVTGTATFSGKLTGAGTNAGIGFGSAITDFYDEAAAIARISNVGAGVRGLSLLSSGFVGWGATLGSNDLYLTRGGAAATLQHGAADAASPVAQTIKFQDVVAGTSNTAGVNATIQAPAGTGTGNGGSLIFQVAAAGSSGTAKNAWATALTIDSTKLATFAGNIDLSTGNPTISRAGTTAFQLQAGRIFTAVELSIASGINISFSNGADYNRALVNSAGGGIALTNGSTGGQSLEMREMTAPAAPATNGVYFYAEDNGAGKTRLMALFATGAAQQVAIEP